MIGTTLSHYRILERLGSGGMGVVYRARDERLERDVALKMLPESALAGPDARRRFRQEAIALSRLNHPAIATVHDFDSYEGADFLVMEFVDGTSLGSQLAEGPLPERDAVALAIQITEGLETAHERGVVHRDLKPGNIMVTSRGQAKVLDFGIANLIHREDGASTSAGTRTGAELGAGTLAYMAPEQLMGANADPRSDLYALGVVLYEMATGRPPFEAKLPTALVYEITSTPPPPPSRIRHDLAPRLEDIILKCLEKRPDYRYQSARELVVDLRRLAEADAGADARATRTQAREIGSLAVLPLENLSGDASQEYFADGMTDALIADLAQIGALRVISRTSVMRMKGARKSLPEIARELDVDAVVEGTVTRAGERVRITAQLIEAATDRHLWAHSYERDFRDILALQGEVAAAIAKEIRIKLTPSQEARLAGARPIDPAAYEAYLKGRHFWNKRTEPDLRRGLVFFNQAIEADPTYALAYSGLADSYNILGDMNAVAPEDAVASARAAVTRALALDDQLAEAHTSLAFVRLFFDWDWHEAEREFKRAIELNPGYATAHQWYAELLVSQARFDEAFTEAKRAMELDPLAFILGTTLGDVFFFSRRFDEAIAQLRRTIDMNPDFIFAHYDLGRVCAQAGRYDDAIAAFQKAARLSGGDPEASPGLAHAYAMEGRREDALRILENLEALRARRYVSPHSIATILVALGEKERAIEWLERAFRERDRGLVWLRVHPRLDPLRSDPRFADLLRRMRLE